MTDEDVKTEETVMMPCRNCGKVPKFTDGGRVLHPTGGNVNRVIFLGCDCGQIRGEYDTADRDLSVGQLKRTMSDFWNESMKTTGIWEQDDDAGEEEEEEEDDSEEEE